MFIETLQEATRRYRLHNPTVSNDELAQRLGLERGLGDHIGSPSSCFSRQGYIAAIRMKQDELVIFNLYQSVQNKMTSIGDMVA